MTHESIYSFTADEIEVPLGLPMLAALNGFTDAGGTISQSADHIFREFSPVELIRFSNEELLDYRSRRPAMFFNKDHISTYEPAVLAIYLVYDDAKQPFLYLHGYEPDFRWEAFADAIEEIILDFEVSQFIWVHSIPFPVPHTRPIGITVSGNRQDLISKYSEWKPETQVPGNVLHLLEFRLSALGTPTVGFVLLVPHYITDSSYPKVAVAAFELISVASGLIFPTDSLRDLGEKFDLKLDKQVAEDDDLRRMVENLEQGYRSERVGPIQSTVRKPEVQVPSADDIAAQLEDYLDAIRLNKSEDEN